MKALPVILILIAAGVLYWVASNRPDAAPVEGAPAEAGSTTAGSTPSGQAADAPGQEPQVVPPRTVPAGSVHGAVRNAGGRGVGGIQVDLVDAAGDTVASTQSAPDGTWSFASVAEGTYQLKAHDPDSLYTMLTSPRVEHGASGSTQADLFADRGTGYVQGTVTSRAGAPLAAATVEVQALERPGLTLRVLTGIKGTFRVGGLPAGNWVVRLPQFSLSHTVALGEGDAGVCDFQVVRNAGLTVRLAAPEDVALEEVEAETRVKIIPHVSTVDAWAEAHPDQLPADGAARAQALRQVSKDLTRQVAVDQEGRAVFGEIFPGRYEVQALFPTGIAEELGMTGTMNLRLEEGQVYEQVLATLSLQEGRALHVPMLVKVLLAVFLGILFLLPMILMPKPVMPNRPQGSQA